MANIRPKRIDRTGQYRTTFDKNAKKILATQDYCALCGKLVDKSLKRPDPMAPEIDHIISIKAGGHPSDIDNLQLTHAICNKRKGDGLNKEKAPIEEPLRWSINWEKYKS